MTNVEKLAWLYVLNIAWFPVLATFVLYDVNGWAVPTDGSIGRYFLASFVVWGLTLAFRGVYLSGKRKGNQ